MAADGPGPARGPVGILAIQGSYPLHVRALRRCGVETREVRRPRDLDAVSALVLPGGESTTMVLLAREYGLLDSIRERAGDGCPMFGTCAGAILLGRGEERPERLALVDVEVARNAYGRQVDSFTADIRIAPLEEPFHAVFIRAPKFRIPPDSSVEVLATAGEDPVLVRSGPILLASFHPELTDDLRVHRYFLDEVCRPS